MDEFKIRSEVIQQQKQKSVRLVQLVLAAILGFFAVTMLMNGELDVVALVSLLVTGLIMFGTAALIFRFFPYEKLYTAYVRLYPEHLEVKINGFTPLMTVGIAEIRALEETKDYLALRKQRGGVLIPKSLENYQALEGKLRERIGGQAQ